MDCPDCPDSETTRGGGCNAGDIITISVIEELAVTMQSLCYPYGSGITCVCDRGEIFKCFPDLKSDSVGGTQGGLKGPGRPGNGVMVGAKTQLADTHMEDTFDRR